MKLSLKSLPAIARIVEAEKPIKSVSTRFVKIANKRLSHIPVYIYAPKHLLSRISQWVKTGIPELDTALGGGVPMGRIIEVFGPESVGKSAFAHLLMTNLHREHKDSEVLLVDTETALDDVRIQSYRPRGLDVNRILYATPVTIEEMFDLISLYLDDRIEQKNKNGKPLPPSLVVWDSIATTPPEASRKRKTHDKQMVGAQARALSDGLQSVNNRFARANCTLIAINQERVKIGAYAPMGMIPTDSPGGKAPKFYCTLRLKLKNTEPIPVSGKPRIGTFVKIRTVKNKIVDPGQDISVVLDYSCGISPDFTLFHALLAARKIRPIGDGKFRFKWNDKQSFKRKDFPALLIANPDLRDKCHKKMEGAKESGEEKEGGN